MLKAKYLFIGLLMVTLLGCEKDDDESPVKATGEMVIGGETYDLSYGFVSARKNTDMDGVYAYDLTLSSSMDGANLLALTTTENLISFRLNSGEELQSGEYAFSGLPEGAFEFDAGQFNYTGGIYGEIIGGTVVVTVVGSKIDVSFNVSTLSGRITGSFSGGYGELGLEI